MSAGTARKTPRVARAMEEVELPPHGRLLKRLATNAVREACEVRKGRLTARALLAYEWLSSPAGAQQTWSLAWICLELDWNLENWRAKALKYVQREWRKLALREFHGDVEMRSRQVRALAHGGGDGYLPLVELSYWHEIADVDLPDKWTPGFEFDAGEKEQG